MKKNIHLKLMSLVALAFVWGSQVQAQVASGYQFSQSNSTFSVPVTGFVGANGLPTNTPMLFPADWDNNGVQLTLPFNFIFDNQSYSTVTLSSNGYLVFGAHNTASMASSSGYISGSPAINNGFSFLGTNLKDVYSFFNSAAGYTTSGSNFVSTWLDGVRPGQRISGPGIPNGTIVTQKVSGGFYMSAPATQTTDGFLPSFLSGATGVYATVSGVAPNRVYTITTVGASRGNILEQFSYKVELSEANHTVRVVYGQMTPFGTAATVQVGIRTTTSDFNGRRTISPHNWASTSASIANSSTCRLATGTVPAEGLTFEWGPCVDVMPEAVAQTFCEGATVADLVAEGSNIKWYSSAAGGTALSSSAVLVTGTYYATQTFGVCESSRLAVAVTVSPQTTYYADADGDGYGNPADAVVACEAPEGYVTNNTDCDDANAAVNATFMFYKDNDEDGYGAGELTPACAVDANTPPVGFSLNNTDCDDSDAGAHMMVAFYADEDGDGRGAGEPVYFCVGEASSVPEGFANNAEDCDDSDESASGLYWFYVDADGDGYGAGELVEVCAADADTPPANYSLNASDCNDSLASVNPGAAEIYYNGIDDNCNGLLDEGNQMTTQVNTAGCGATLSKIYTSINMTQLPNITQYRFKVYKLGDNPANVQYLERPQHWFSLNMLSEYDYESTYEVSCELQYNGVWLGYFGPVCYVSSPAILDTGVLSVGNVCGQTLDKIYRTIGSTQVSGATSYRFRITDLSNEPHDHTVQVFDRGSHWFSLDMLPRFNYGTTYSIEVAVKTTGDYTDYGQPCFVATPDVPTLTGEFCGTQENPAIVTLPYASISAENESRITDFRYQITDMTNFETQYLDRGPWFSLDQVLGVEQGKTYRIRLSVMTGGTWSVFGDPCYITYTTTAAMRAPEQAKEMFAAVAYPSPFDANFSIDLKAATLEPVQVRIYDMLGKLVEDRTVDAKVMSDAKFGERLPSGVFNVVVSQGVEVKTLRVIKR